MKNSRLGSALMSVAIIAALIAPQAALATTTIKLSGSTTLQPLAQTWAAAYHKLHKTTNIIVTGGGSGVGFTDVRDGKVDIGMTSREPNAGTFETNQTKYRVARDAVAVIVNPGNTRRHLTAAQVKGIFTGTITNWKQLGGDNAAIILCGRTGASGTYSYFKSAFLGGSKQSSRTKTYASNGMVRSAVARQKYAVGYMSIGYLNASIRATYIDNVLGSKSNAISGAYKYVRPLYFLTSGSVPTAVKSFITWCQGTTGQSYATKEYLHR
jgi:phosphate transport system substrate-binding protein